MNASPATQATPGEVAGSITRAWLGYFIVMAVVGLVLSIVIGGIFNFLARSMTGSPAMMQLSIWATSLLIHAPISWLVFHWAVRGKVLPAVLLWNAGGPSEG